ncbi:hypothetical protein [Cerasicoccus maritimus]|uniref:hypothetical protein n=1 Tax=Cerasicoccus maritimus TaxID=490089 RepID=UPI002852845A|nr:hypothetical protein [Cerasicoccus maritimus]
MQNTPSTHGKRTAKNGVILLAVSNLAIILIIFLGINIPAGLFTMLGGLATVGLIMVFVAMTKHHYRAKWLFWFLIGYSVLLFISPPVGPAIAIAIWVFLAIKGKSFFPPKSASIAQP